MSDAVKKDIRTPPYDLSFSPPATWMMANASIKDNVMGLPIMPRVSRRKTTWTKPAIGKK